ncbi:MAG: glycosyltransferase [Deltaproteobacteria bacterium]|nr:glycosyltransferase [Deltaproteobacteria bacterium]
MRIVLDLQSAQTVSAKRGIGRYSLSLAQAIIQNCGEHEVILALNNMLLETIEPIRYKFDGLLPQENIRVWAAKGPVLAADLNNTWRRNVTEYLREAFLASLQPDVILVSSLFEGYLDNAVTSIGMFSQQIPTAVSLYDLIPYIYRHLYLANPTEEKWYQEKLDHLQRADLLLAISESSRREAIDYLGFPINRVVNVSAAADSHFRIIDVHTEEEQRLRQKSGLSRPFLMYICGIDHRKNIEGLIRAFASMPIELRRAYQLAIICSSDSENRRKLELLSRQQGLNGDEVVIMDFVSDDELTVLYNLCTLYVFPSWHEGFGLPALEAMHCGAPVIGASTSSLPEVIGREDALFDPHSEESITAKIVQVLTDDAFRLELIRHGAKQAGKFSWDESAKRTIAALENLHEERRDKKPTFSFLSRRPKLAFISPPPPKRTLVVENSAELLLELSRFYDIEVIVAQNEVSDARIKTCCQIRSIEWFIKHANQYERKLYYFDNSSDHAYIRDLLDRFPGAVVLHDFFLGAVPAPIDIPGFPFHLWVREIYRAHGYTAVKELCHTQNPAEAISKYPCNLTVLQQANGVIAHSTSSIRLVCEWYGEKFAENIAIIPQLCIPVNGTDQASARRKLGLAVDDYIICSFGSLGLINQSHRLLDAWLASKPALNDRSKLVFVGENDSGVFGEELRKTIVQSGREDRIHITGEIDSETLRLYFEAADVAVQLHQGSRGEAYGTILDCMNYGLAVIANAGGVITDLPNNTVFMLPEEFEDKQLAEALEMLWCDQERRVGFGGRARESIITLHAPRKCADQYFKAIEIFYENAKTDRESLVRAVAKLEPAPLDKREWVALAASIAQNLPLKQPARQLLVDISELVQRDAKTGIQRVVRGILKEILDNPPSGFRVEPVYATTSRLGYYYARDFTLRFLGCPTNGLTDEPIEIQPGDHFLGLDLQSHVVPYQIDYLLFLRFHGVQVNFVVYDLLPILQPYAFPDGVNAAHTRYLQAITKLDGAICISRAVADELAAWLDTSPPERLRPLKIGWFHLGADIENTIPTCDISEDIEHIISRLANSTNFLMVGTVEPRKGYMQTLTAFELLWAEGLQVNLVVIGRQGWKVEAIVKKIRKHPELGKRLFWLEGISDHYMKKAYAASTCLIAASDGEGFGLPLIEAAEHNVPIIARDIPVFNEVGGEFVFYFSGKEATDLAEAIKRWLALFEQGQHPKSDYMPRLTWKQSADQLKQILLEDNWYMHWSPEKSPPRN